MKLEKWQREKLRELFEGYLDGNMSSVDMIDVNDLVEFVEQVLSLEPEGAPGSIGNMLVEEAYKRFMAEWKQVGVWVGGKPVRAKLGRLIRDKKIGDVWAGLERLRNDPNRPRPEYVPRPMTWLNQERWNDDPYPEKSGGRQAAAGAVLDIQLSPSHAAVQNQHPSIMGELNQGRW